ncbi:HET-domain-containing protein, partial [Mollisia scopiformis]
MHIISPSLFDADFAKSCIAYCDIHHGQACTTLREGLPFLRVIDCRTRQVVRAPVNCQYVALSYVWGSSTSDIVLDEELPQSNETYLPRCPDVIENSLSVTTMIGAQYLWIDRYCIDQEDSVDKHHQITHMDAIYANAFITIIAAAGDGPDYGLPGVERPRKVHPHLLIDRNHLVSTLPHASALVNSSRWASRGWTYQEGILSKRRLIFTDEQVYFECSNLYCAESLRLSTSEDQILRMESRTRFLANLPSRHFPQDRTELNPWQIMSCISDFSKRQLSFASDTLNALQGIFRMFAKAKTPVYNLCGVPILDCGSVSRF